MNSYSLGVPPNKMNELINIKKISNLAENLKQFYYQDYITIIISYFGTESMFYNKL